ncbi:hypothetical protein D9615_010484 [Tricholomella constricta]|uniref:Phospho-2-dehydro-3-deoxyheptonate aldolase n=1 Tax=Tricholomella constricta TaxID=117010 RepID=A0A8H5GN76_9AGAR|nr:hypothetical protein D9615_010484 [Tricholomella constricta]
MVQQRSRTTSRRTSRACRRRDTPLYGYAIPCMETSGLKTRHFGTIVAELAACLRIHAAHGSRLGGVSLEFTGELNEEGFSVTECVGGSMELGEEQLGLRYQSLDVAFLISNHFKKERRNGGAAGSGGKGLGEGEGGEGGPGEDVLYDELVGRFAAGAGVVGVAK